MVKYWKVMLILIGLLVIIAVAANNLTSLTAFCASCHQAQNQSRQGSTHSQYGCVACHKVNPLTKGAMLARSWTGKPIPIAVKNNSCLDCHRTERVITPSRDLTIPHFRHMEKDIECTRCHSGVGHVTVAAKEAEGGMVLCLNCHYQRGKPLNCRACHRDPPITLAHLEPGWKYRHGGDALKNIAACNGCHKFTLFLETKSQPFARQPLESVAVYAKNNVYCAACHRLRPPTHNDYFLHDHALIAFGQEKRCLICHNWDYPLPVEKLPDLYCQQCHAYPGWVPVPWGKPQPSIP